jgi:hypothetical protein
MNLGEMRQMVRETVRDHNENFVQDWEIDGWVNEAYSDIAARLRSYQKKLLHSDVGAAAITSGALTYPSDMVELLSLRLGTDDVVFVPDDVFNNWADAADDGLDYTIGRVFNDTIEFWPAPANSSAYTMRYAAYPVELESADATPYLPRDMHVRLVHYARAMALLKDHNPFASEYMALYERTLPPPPTGLVKLRPGPLSMTLQMGPFDLDFEARHL